MGDMLLEEFREELVYVLANRNDTGTTTARLNRWINRAYRHMTRPRVHKHLELKFRHDFPLVTGINEYALDRTTVGRQVLGVVDVTAYDSVTITEDVNRRDLKPRPIQWMNLRTKASGPPSFYTFDSNGGELLVLNTRPTTAENGRMVRVTYWGEPTALVDGAATVLSPYWDDVLILGAQFFAEWQVVSKAEATATGQLYQAMINENFEAGELSYEDTDHLVEVESEAYMER